MRGLSGLLPALVLALAASTAAALDIGEKAPDLDVADWVQGDPVVLEQCAGKKVVVVELWASFCEPCKKALPRLSRIAEKFAAQGVEVAAITDEKADDVKTFLKDKTYKFHVGCDELRNTVVPYARGVRNTAHSPYSFVIDKTGAVVWQGSSLSGLERALQQVLAGKLDAAKAKSVDELQKVVEENFDLKRWAEAAVDSEKLLEADPGNEKGLLSYLRSFAAAKEPAKLKAFVEKTLPKIDDDAVALNAVAWELATAENPAMRQPAAAYQAAKRAVELSGGKDAAILDTLARVQSQLGLLDQAIETQGKAVAIDDTDEEIKAKLEYYKACAEARKAAK